MEEKIDNVRPNIIIVWDQIKSFFVATKVFYIKKKYWKYNSYEVFTKTYEEIVTRTLLNQLGVAGKNTLLSFNNEKVEANFSKLCCE